MWDTTLLDSDDEELSGERAVAFDVLYQALQAGTGVHDDAELLAQTAAAWSVVHGIATLWLSGNLPYPRDSQLVAQAFRDLGPALLPVAQTSLDQLSRRPLS